MYTGINYDDQQLNSPWRCWGFAPGSSKDPGNGVKGEKWWTWAPLGNSTLVWITKFCPEKSKLILASKWVFRILGDPGPLAFRCSDDSGGDAFHTLNWEQGIQVFSLTAPYFLQALWRSSCCSKESKICWFLLPMDWVTQVNALKRGGWFLPLPPMQDPSTSPMTISTLVSPLSGACYRETSNYRAHSRGSSNCRSISWSVTKVNTQVALNSFEVSSLLLGKPQG